MREISVTLGDRSYPIIVGSGTRGRLSELVPPGAHRAAVVTQAAVGWRVEPGIESRTFEVPDGERAKTITTAEMLCRQWSAWGLNRTDVVIAVGGGVVTDLAGFAAAMYHRGTSVINVATTLLGQVDAAIGGKTGVNLPEGKNLVGAFWQPVGVICDLETLDTLPPREYRSGLGEMAKYAFLGVDGLAEMDIEEAVAACAGAKAAVVSADEREAGSRALLNYGHTLAHALETTGRYDLRHGEAVAIGLVFAAELALSLERVSPARVAEHRDLVAGYALSTELPAAAVPAELVAVMARDKKATAGLTFVLDGPAGLEVTPGVDPEVVIKTLEAMSARP